MPIHKTLLESSNFRRDLEAYVKRAPEHGSRPAGRARALHLTMQKALTRGPTPNEVMEFAQGYKRRAEAELAAIVEVAKQQALNA